MADTTGEIILILTQDAVEALFNALDVDQAAIVLAKARSLDDFDRNSYAKVLEIAQRAGKLCP